MSVVKMKYINISGPEKMLDYTISNYLIRNDIQIEKSIKSDTSGKILSEITTSNPYNVYLKNLQAINKHFKVEKINYSGFNIEEMFADNKPDEELESYIKRIESIINEYKNKKDTFLKDIDELKGIEEQLKHIIDLDVDVQEFFNLEFIKVRFGKISKENFKKLHLFTDEQVFFVFPLSIDENDVWLSYFMPKKDSLKIDAIFNSLHFKRIRISANLIGTPPEAIEDIHMEVDFLKKSITENDKEFEEIIEMEREEFIKYYCKINYLYKINEVKKCSSKTQKAFYITGWVSAEGAKIISNELDKDKYIAYIFGKPEQKELYKEPTLLKNNSFFKPFEMVTRMYGLPSYNEIDPTPFVAITTLVMFGVMFGDIGQGLFILLLGLFLKFKFKAGFSGIAIWGGISSIMFGFLYGSIFANEEIIKPIWAHPMHSINTILIISVSYGIVLTLISMCLNLVNCFKHGNRGGLIFDKNGIAGILFYLIIITSIVAYIIKGKMIIPVPIIIILMLISVLAMFLKEPLENLIEKKNHFLPEDKGGFFVESIFELLETIMGFISNTISFVRIGAFALNHAGLSLAIWTLYNMANGSAGILVIVFGNLLIIGMEGLIVGIQCLRLQYYEIFSHFFKGEGVEFENINIDRIKV